MSIVSQLCERASARRKALTLSVNSGKLKSDHMGPHYARVKIDWDTQVDWRSYWAKTQQPICSWSLKTSH